LDQQEPTDLAGDLRAYLAGSRDSKRELALLRRVRAQPQEMRQQLLVPLLDLNTDVVLEIANRAQLSRAAYLAILKRGLDEADASSIRHWLAATVLHLGWRKVFSVLRQELAVKPRRVSFALYHVPYLSFDKPFLSLPTTTALMDEFCQLVELCHRKGYVVCPDKPAFEVIRDRALRTNGST